jgi:cyclic beta-1,2-glucan synthetase
MTWRMHDTRYEIAVSNPEGRCRGVTKADLDGEAVDAAAIPMIEDGGVHHVRIVLGHATPRVGPAFS